MCSSTVSNRRRRNPASPKAASVASTVGYRSNRRRTSGSSGPAAGRRDARRRPPDQHRRPRHQHAAQLAGAGAQVARVVEDGRQPGTGARPVTQRQVGARRRRGGRRGRARPRRGGASPAPARPPPRPAVSSGRAPPTRCPCPPPRRRPVPARYLATASTTSGSYGAVCVTWWRVCSGRPGRPSRPPRPGGGRVGLGRHPTIIVRRRRPGPHDLDEAGPAVGAVAGGDGPVVVRADGAAARGRCRRPRWPRRCGRPWRPSSWRC